MCQSRVSAHFPGRSSEICSTSLSPRPDKHCGTTVSAICNSDGSLLTITMSESLGRVFANRTPSQIAWDDSKAAYNVKTVISRGNLRASVHTRNDAFQLSTHTEAPKRFFVSSGNIFSSARVFQPGVLRTNSRIIKSSADRVCLDNLTSRRLKNICPDTMKNAWLAHRQCSTVAHSVGP
jgi:hypothetical protein